MAAESWPATVPSEFLRRGFRLQPLPNTQGFPTDQGAGKRRKRFTQARRLFRGTIRMTPSEWDTFKSFYMDTINAGSDEFDFPDPMGSSDIEVRFVRTPQRTRNRADWLVTCALRTVP